MAKKNYLRIGYYGSMLMENTPDSWLFQPSEELDYQLASICAKELAESEKVKAFFKEHEEFSATDFNHFVSIIMDWLQHSRDIARISDKFIIEGELK